VNREAKNTGICRLFRRFGDSMKGCPPVLLLDHIIFTATGRAGPVEVRTSTAAWRLRHESTDSKKGSRRGRD
jgi:hypothetical protein